MDDSITIRRIMNGFLLQAYILPEDNEEGMYSPVLTETFVKTAEEVGIAVEDFFLDQ